MFLAVMYMSVNLGENLAVIKCPLMSHFEGLNVRNFFLFKIIYSLDSCALLSSQK